MTLVDDKSQGIRIAMLMVCEKLQGIRTSVTLVDDKSQGIRIAMLMVCEKLACLPGCLQV